MFFVNNNLIINIYFLILLGYLISFILFLWILNFGFFVIFFLNKVFSLLLVNFFLLVFFV